MNRAAIGKPPYMLTPVLISHREGGKKLQDQWVFINGFAGWLSGFGSLSAVVVSLYLARRDMRIRLRISADIRQIVFSGPPPVKKGEFITIAVTNVGRRSARVTGLFWKNLLIPHLYLLQIPGDAPLSAQLPARLQDGDEADFTVPVQVFAKNDAAVFCRLLPRPRKLMVQFLRMQVRTSTGEVFGARIDKELKKWLLAYIAGGEQLPQ
jgi:hypothetical protein